uniref:ester cyclase n=1 Tax=Herbidospora sakaeratensis TaxID=564415 RepID=UPI00078638B5|nr:ester cyclase [Herbidospora sakaeratensis]
MSDPWDIRRRLSDLINAHDMSGLLRMYSPDAVLVAPAGIAEGRDEIAWFYEQAFCAFPDYRQTAWLEVPGDDPMVREWVFTGTHLGNLLLPDGREVEPTGRHITVRAACMTYVVDEMVVTHRDYYDQLELFSQLGFGLTELPRAAGRASAGY